MKRVVFACVIALVALSLFSTSTGRASVAQKAAGGASAPVDTDKIIRAFTAKETEFRRALNAYAFTRDADVQTIGMGGEVTGEYNRVSQFVFNDSGERFEHITFFPQPTLTEISFTNEDLEDLGGVQPFALEASKIDQYNFTYVGKEKIDELNLYVFDVSPKVMPKKESERMFQGRVWVDDQDLQIVKVRGKGEHRVEALRLADAFRARVIDATTESFVFEITGNSTKISQFVDLMRPLGLVEVSRTGVAAIGRGPEGM